MNNKGLIYWLGIILLIWLLWPLIKTLVVVVLIIAVVLFLIYTFRKPQEKDYIEKADSRKPSDDKVIDVEFKTKEKDD